MPASQQRAEWNEPELESAGSDARSELEGLDRNTGGSRAGIFSPHYQRAWILFGIVLFILSMLLWGCGGGEPRP